MEQDQLEISPSVVSNMPISTDARNYNDEISKKSSNASTQTKATSSWRIRPLQEAAFAFTFVWLLTLMAWLSFVRALLDILQSEREDPEQLPVPTANENPVSSAHKDGDPPVTGTPELSEKYNSEDAHSTDVAIKSIIPDSYYTPISTSLADTSILNELSQPDDPTREVTEDSFQPPLTLPTSATDSTDPEETCDICNEFKKTHLLLTSPSFSALYQVFSREMSDSEELPPPLSPVPVIATILVPASDEELDPSSQMDRNRNHHRLLACSPTPVKDLMAKAESVLCDRLRPDEPTIEISLLPLAPAHEGITIDLGLSDKQPLGIPSQVGPIERAEPSPSMNPRQGLDVLEDSNPIENSYLFETASRLEELTAPEDKGNLLLTDYLACQSTTIDTKTTHGGAEISPGNCKEPSDAIDAMDPYHPEEENNFFGVESGPLQTENRVENIAPSYLPSEAEHSVHKPDQEIPIISDEITVKTGKKLGSSVSSPTSFSTTDLPETPENSELVTKKFAESEPALDEILSEIVASPPRIENTLTGEMLQAIPSLDCHEDDAPGANLLPPTVSEDLSLPSGVLRAQNLTQAMNIALPASPGEKGSKLPVRRNSKSKGKRNKQNNTVVLNAPIVSKKKNRGSPLRQKPLNAFDEELQPLAYDKDIDLNRSDSSILQTPKSRHVLEPTEIESPGPYMTPRSSTLRAPGNLKRDRSYESDSSMRSIAKHSRRGYGSISGVDRNYVTDLDGNPSLSPGKGSRADFCESGNENEKIHSQY
ncbi:MAG: hypothetical protein M1829_000773 [Trizodia sp. TS-e1964]|nr:MAG: hypothetical protein M1829_000773 [Trizodia sp. TS-e1964]